MCSPAIRAYLLASLSPSTHRRALSGLALSTCPSCTWQWGVSPRSLGLGLRPLHQPVLPCSDFVSRCFPPFLRDSQVGPTSTLPTPGSILGCQDPGAFLHDLLFLCPLPLWDPLSLGQSW